MSTSQTGAPWPPGEGAGQAACKPAPHSKDTAETMGACGGKKLTPRGRQRDMSVPTRAGHQPSTARGGRRGLAAHGAPASGSLCPPPRLPHAWTPLQDALIPVLDGTRKERTSTEGHAPRCHIDKNVGGHSSAPHGKDALRLSWYGVSAACPGERT